MDMQQFEELRSAIKAVAVFEKIQKGEIQTELLNEDDFKEILDSRNLVLNYANYFDVEKLRTAISKPSP